MTSLDTTRSSDDPVYHDTEMFILMTLSQHCFKYDMIFFVLNPSGAQTRIFLDIKADAAILMTWLLA